MVNKTYHEGGTDLRPPQLHAAAEGGKEPRTHTCPRGAGRGDHRVDDASDEHRLAELVAARDDALLQQRHDLHPRTRAHPAAQRSALNTGE